jgi:hypothetical protein
MAIGDFNPTTLIDGVIVRLRWRVRDTPRRLRWTYLRPSRRQSRVVIDPALRDVGQRLPRGIALDKGGEWRGTPCAYLGRSRRRVDTTTTTKEGKGKDDHDDVVLKGSNDWLRTDYLSRMSVLVAAPPKQSSWTTTDAAKH